MGVINHMSNPMNNGNVQIPEIIVVAVLNTDRARDLTPTNSNLDHNGEPSKIPSATTGGGDQFLTFLRRELIPEVDSKLRTRPHRTMVGHSLGGLIVMQSLLTQPGLFRNYIAIDSSLWWDDQVLVKRLQDKQLPELDHRPNVYLSIADHNVTGVMGGASTMIFANMAFAETLADKGKDVYDTRFQRFEGEDHGSVPLLSLYYGLLHAFEGYKPRPELFVKGPDDVATHFRHFSTDQGAEFLPPEQLIDLVVKFMAEPLEMSQETVRAYYELNAANYPESQNAAKALRDFLNQAAGSTD